ncbi:hypothetical protein RQP46_007606 [Phenoliferia psychrophenolica]
MRSTSTVIALAALFTANPFPNLRMLSIDGSTTYDSWPILLKSIPTLTSFEIASFFNSETGACLGGLRNAVTPNIELLSLYAVAALVGATGAAQAGIDLTAIETLFIFGDSYTATGYRPQNGTNNIPDVAESKTTSGGKNWIQFLAEGNPSTANSYYNFAVSGATTNNSIVNATIPSTVAALVPVIFIGINDIGFPYAFGLDLPTIVSTFFPMLQEDIFASRKRLVEKLYNDGARQFLFMGLPPMSRAPLVGQWGQPAVDSIASNIASYNTEVESRVAAMPDELSGTTALYFDTKPVFYEVLDNFEDYGLTSNDSVSFGRTHIILRGQFIACWLMFLANQTRSLPTATATIAIPQTSLPPGAQTALPSSLIPVLPATATSTIGVAAPAKAGGNQSARSGYLLALVPLVAAVAALL